MSVFTTLPRAGYDDRAFAAFEPDAEGFVPGNALAMAWAAQLAYETATPDKMRDVAAAWGLGALEPLIARLDAGGFLTVADTRGFVAAGDRATIVGFSGTDPPVLAHWLTNFDAAMTPHDGGRIHAGFLRAAVAVRPMLEDALRRHHVSGQPLFFVGHSLGAALAVVAARLLASEANPVSGVYAFGMPRAGDGGFAAACGAALGSRIYRLVHGDDLVPGVPFGLLGYRHVGRYLRCPSGGSFAAAALTADWSSNEPNLGRDVVVRLIGEFAKASSWRWPIVALGSRESRLREVLGNLPVQIRDHLPDRYIAACDAAAR